MMRGILPAVLIASTCGWAVSGVFGGQPNNLRDDPPTIVLEQLEPQTWALISGIDDYTELPDRSGNSKDIAQLGSQLVLCGVPVSNIFLMNDRSQAKYLPSKSNIERQLELIPKLASSNDIILLAFRCRVAHLSGTSYLCPSEADYESPVDTLIPVESVFRALEQSRAQTKLLVIDPTREGDETQATLPPEFVSSLRAHPSSTIVVVGTGLEQRLSEYAQHSSSVLLATLRHALAGAADKNTDQAISISELLQFITTETDQPAASTPQLFGRPSSDPVIAQVAEHETTESLYPTLNENVAETAGRLEAVTGITPRSLRAFNQAVAHFSMGDFQEAVEFCNDAAAMDPENHWAHILRGCIYGRLQDFGRAIEDYAKLGIPFPCHAKTEAELMQGSDVMATVLPGQVLHITAIDGDWLWVVSVGNDRTKQGWVDKGHVW